MRAFLTQRFLPFLVLVVLSWHVSGWAIDGIAVSVRSLTLPDTGCFSGKIFRHAIFSGKVTESKTIYGRDDARCVCISPSGTRVAFIRKDGKLCFKNISGNGPLSILIGDLDWREWIDWPVEEWIYYTRRNGSNDIRRINVLTRKAEKCGRFPGPAGQISISHDMSRGCAVLSSGETKIWCFSFINGNTADWFTKTGASGSISHDGKLCCLYQNGYSAVKIFDFDNARKPVCTFDRLIEAGDFWSAIRFAANSFEWLTCTQGDSSNDDRHLNQVIYKKDGTDYVVVTKNSILNAGFDRGDDFWVGNPDYALNPRPAIKPDSARVSFLSESFDSAIVLEKQVAVRNGGTPGMTLPRLHAIVDSPWVSAYLETKNGVQWLVLSVDKHKAGIGEHRAIVTIDGPGLAKERVNVFYAVRGAPVISNLFILPESLTLAPESTALFKTAAQDQYGKSCPVPYMVLWSASPGCSVDSHGILTAGSRACVCTVFATVQKNAAPKTAWSIVTVRRRESIKSTSVSDFKEPYPARKTGLAPIAMLVPQQNVKYKTGEYLNVRWTVDTLLIDSVRVYASDDNGEDWGLISGKTSLPSHFAGSDTGGISWMIPSPGPGTNPLLLQYGIKVQCANARINTKDQKTFQVENYPGATVAAQQKFTEGIGLFGITALGANQSYVNVPFLEPFAVKIVGLDGKHVSSYTGIGPQIHYLSSHHLHSGVYLVRVATGQHKISRLVMIGE
jgi:hypothetical protein